MKLVAKRGSFGSYGQIERGTVIEVDDKKQANLLIEKGGFEAYDPEKAAKKNAERAARATELEASRKLPSLSETEIGELIAGNTVLTAKVNELTIAADRVPLLLASIGEKNEEIATAGKTIDALNAEISDLKANRSISETAVIAANDEIAALKAQVEELTKSSKTTGTKATK